jgi:16S rRNA (cytosine1402-N4)-methyltransferase
LGEQDAARGTNTPGAATGSAAHGAPHAEHMPVLLARCLELLAPAVSRPGAVQVDATLGLGGHAEAVLSAHPSLTLIGLDRDAQALELARRRLAPYADRVHLLHSAYDELPAVLDRLDMDTVDGVLFDLGVSSLQLDDPARGFAYAQDAPLDMRMDQTSGITAELVVNEYPQPELTRVLRVYGEERFAARISATIVRERGKRRITSSAHLAELVRQSIPAAARRTGGNPAKRTFQALRIEVNGELGSLEAGLTAALDVLALSGRIVVLAYHSLEDRIVKRALADRARPSGPPDLPVELPGSGPRLRLLTRGAEQPSAEEIAANPRAASARLRAAQRVNPDAGKRPLPAMHQPTTRGRAGATGTTIAGTQDNQIKGDRQ